MSLKSIDALLEWGGKRLKSSGIGNPGSEALLLLAGALCGGPDYGRQKAKILTHPEMEASPSQAEKYKGLVERRCKCAPVAYLLKSKEFMGLDFHVDENVLIPRPDTEILVEEAIGAIRKNRFSSFLDVCTGSGCIAIALAHYCKEIKNAAACDISSKALAIAKRNAEAYGVNIDLILSDMFGNISRTFDLIVSNPPYIEREEIENLPPSVKNHEPALALDGGSDGLDFHRILASCSKAHLNDGGILMMEIGALQAESVSSLLRKEGFMVYIRKDLAGLDRVACASLAD